MSADPGATPRPFSTVPQLAALLDISEDTIRREIKDGRLRARTLRSQTVIVAADLAAWIAAFPVVPVETPEPAVAPAPEPVKVERHRKGGRQVVVRLFDPIARAAP